MKRRNFLRGLSAASVAGGAMLLDGPTGLGLRFARASTAPGKVVVMVFQRGGCDGLNTVVPYRDGDYYSLRPTIAVQPPSASSESAIDLDGFFGLHPSLSALRPIWDSGELAVLPAVQYPDASRSHFSGQRRVESGTPTERRDGWLNRYLQQKAADVGFGALGVGSLPHSLKGAKRISVLGNDAKFQLEVPLEEDAPLRARLAQAYDLANSDGRPAQALVHEFGTRFLQDIETLNSVDLASVPVSVDYPNTGFGRSLRKLSQFLKLGHEQPAFAIEAATVSIGGWDSHSNQGGGEASGSQSGRLRDFALSLAAFYADLGDQRDNVLVLTQTEFGRTARENGSRGTDHGHASAWFAMNGNINGGMHVGTWPGLASAVSGGRNYLNHSVDYRDIYADVLQSHFALPDVLGVLGDQDDGHVPTPIGLL